MEPRLIFYLDYFSALVSGLLQTRLEKYEPRHVISNNVVCATSKGLYQPAHRRSLIRAFASRLNIL